MESENIEKEMHKAVCSSCEQECEVPFEPVDGKDIYCKECYKNRKDNRNSDREMHKAVCSSCNQECEVPFKPTEGRPVYCRDCYRQNGPRNF